MPSDIPDSIVAVILAGAAEQETVASLWSSIITPRSMPGDTLKDTLAPGYAPPEILPKTVAFPGQNMTNADYTILSRLGEGGMGVVFEARQNHLNRTVALKMIRPERAGDPLARTSFFYEAVITAGLEHPGIVPILEFGRAQDGRDFYAMKKASGVPWSRVIRERTLEENLGILDRVADVVAYAHSRGILHRDLKPANVLLGDFGEVWVIDWGVAVTVGSDGTYSHALPGGTPLYMPPEAARGDNARLGPASDMYLLGAILFEILTGMPPHIGADALSALQNAAANTIADVDSRIGLLTVANKAMSAFPGHRYRDVRAFRQAIRRCLSEHEGQALLKQANGQLAEAQRLGHYELYQQAVSDFDAALAAFPENIEALNGRVRALLAFGRQALSNAEYDLALSIIKPEVKASSKAATLAQTITREKAAAELLRRRRKRVNTVLGLMVVSLLLTGAYVAHYRYDIIANLTRSGIDDAGQQNAFLHLKRALENLQRRVHAVTLKANTYNQPELQEIQDLQEQYKSLLPVFNDCIKKFDEEPWDTPARRNRVGLYIRSRIPEIEEGIRRIHSLGEHLSGGRIGEGLEEHIDGMMQQFASVTRYLRGMSLIGE